LRPRGDIESALRGAFCRSTNADRQAIFDVSVLPIVSVACWGEVDMKRFTIAAVILALVATPALAQGRRGQQKEDKAAEKPKVDEKAYKAALDRIPTPKEKYDPWGVTKTADPASKPK
jgi:hypothetical protein